MRTKEDRKSRELVAGGLLKVAEAAKFLGLSRSKVYAMLAAGELESTKMGATRRIPRNAVEQLAARSLAPSTPAA
jgi:excisionase family DNA binding protein